MFKPSSRFLPLCAALAIAVAACDNAPVPPPSGEAVVNRLDVVLNPSGFVPLAAQATLEATRPVQVEVYIQGRTSGAADVRHRFDKAARTHALPILGLYPSTDNEVTFLLFDASGEDLGSVTRTVTTDPMAPGMPTVRIDVKRPGYLPGMNLISYFGVTGDFLPMTPVITDADGSVRWFADFGEHKTLNQLFYDVGIERLANGNLYFGDGNSGRIYEIDMLGYVVNEWPIPGYTFHHNVLEMTPGGNLLATVNQQGLATIEDQIIEIDRTSGNIVNKWDLRESLDMTRRTMDPSSRDWFHANGLAYDAVTDEIIVSGRVQGVVRLTPHNEVVWILAPHTGWGTAGNGENLNQKLLTPLDATDSPITVTDVVEGFMAHPDFDWPWYQHAPKLLPNGDLLVFDNGHARHFSESSPRYSRAVVYRIDEANMTVRQVWEYGKARGIATYSHIVSDVDYHPNQDNIVFMPGAAWSGATPVGKAMEVDVNSRDVLLEFEVRAANAAWGITFHRIERMPLYPPNQ